MQRYDVVVVGAGIVGLAHALAASKRGARALVLERSVRARGASVRNFGMIWPIGQPAGPLLNRALRSREIWLECAARGEFAVERCGALHLAMRSDEMQVLSEFQDRHRESGYETRLVTATQAGALCPGVLQERILGGLRSELELCIDPREAMGALPGVLARSGVEVRFEQHVRGVGAGRVELSDGTEYRAERTLVCSGAEMRTLFPRELAGAGLVQCKLQMMRTGSQPGNWRVGTHLAAGLTLIHYKAFAACESLAALRRRFEAEYPAHLAAGVHVLVSQNARGEITLGDSHEYGPETGPFDSAGVDKLVLDYLGEFFQCPSPAIQERWHGVYAKSTTGATEFVSRVEPGVYLVTGIGGNGMTLSFGLAEETIDDILADRVWRAQEG